MVFLSYDKDVTGHPENKDVTLRLMSLERQENQRARQALRRPGHHQRALLVAGQQAGCVRELPVDPGRRCRYEIVSNSPYEAWLPFSSWPHSLFSCWPFLCLARRTLCRASVFRCMLTDLKGSSRRSGIISDMTSPTTPTLPMARNCWVNSPRLVPLRPMFVCIIF